MKGKTIGRVEHKPGESNRWMGAEAEDNRKVEHKIGESNEWMTVEVEDNWKSGTKNW